MGFCVKENWWILSLLAIWIQQEVHHWMQGCWGTAAILLGSRGIRPGRCLAPGTGRAPVIYMQHGLSWPECQNIGNIMDTLQFLGKNQWDCSKHIVLQAQGLTQPSSPFATKRSLPWPGCSPCAIPVLPKHDALPLLSCCVDKPWFSYINNTGPLEAIQPLNLLIQSLSLRSGWGLMRVEQRLSHICQLWYASICWAPVKAHGQTQPTDPMQQFLHSLLLLKWQHIIRYVFLR